MTANQTGQRDHSAQVETGKEEGVDEELERAVTELEREWASNKKE
jgi:hypothetical protein